MAFFTRIAQIWSLWVGIGVGVEVGAGETGDSGGGGMYSMSPEHHIAGLPPSLVIPLSAHHYRQPQAD